MADRVTVNPPNTGAVTDSQADDLYAALAERNIYSRGDLDLAILAIEAAARDEGRREAVREIRNAVEDGDPLLMLALRPATSSSRTRRSATDE